MHDFVSHWRITIGAFVSALLLGWAAVVNTGGSWPAMLSTAALATLLVTSTTVLVSEGRLMWRTADSGQPTMNRR